MQITVTDKNNNKMHQVKGLEGYEIDNSMDIPAGKFSLILSNAAGALAKIFRPNFIVQISEEDTIILKGSIDVVSVITGETGSFVQLSGRSMAAVLLDNDAAPQTYQSLNLEGFIKKIAEPYGFTSFEVDSTAGIAKIVVDDGMSEWDMINREAYSELGMIPWVAADGTIVCKKTDLNADADYRFGNDVENATHWEELKIRDHLTDVKSELWGKNYQMNDFVVEKDADLIAAGFKRRSIIKYSTETREQIGKKLKHELKERKKGCYEISLTVRGSKSFLPGKIAYLHDTINGIDGKFLVAGVTQTKDVNGTKTSIRLWKDL